VIPPFMSAVDKAISYLEPTVGILGVADFYTSLRFDIPERQQWYVTRWFWRCIFDLDNIDLSPERRVYLDHLLQRGKFPFSLPVLPIHSFCFQGLACYFLKCCPLK
jgi:betaine lipid synthase